MSGEENMSDQKRTTVTIIETHEVWIVRKAVPEPPDGDVKMTPAGIAQPTQVPAVGEPNDSAEMNEPNKGNEES